MTLISLAQQLRDAKIKTDILEVYPILTEIKKELISANDTHDHCYSQIEQLIDEVRSNLDIKHHENNYLRITMIRGCLDDYINAGRDTKTDYEKLYYAEKAKVKALEERLSKIS